MDPRVEALLDARAIFVRTTNADAGARHFWGTWHVERSTTLNPPALDLGRVEIRVVESEAIDAHRGRLVLDVRTPQEK